MFNFAALYQFLSSVKYLNLDMTKRVCHRFMHAFCEIPQLLCTTPQPRLIMTLLVKDEEAVLEQNLIFHHAMGVDGFIVTDNNSTDRTPEIIERYKAKGWILESIYEPHSGYEQKRWVDRMVMIAKKRYKADWVINADADEFWWTPLGSLKEEMAHTHANVLRTEMRVVYPYEGQPWTAWRDTVRPLPEAERAALGLSPYTIFAPNRSKVAHRTAGYLHIAMGNHKVAMFLRRRHMSGIKVYHYIWHGHDHFLRKVINGGRELEKHSSKHGGQHWRNLYNIYKEGHLEEEYARIFALEHLEDFRQRGLLVTDCPVPEILTSSSVSV